MLSGHKTNIYIIGAGGLGREIAATISNNVNYSIHGFVDDKLPEGKKVNGRYVIGGLDKLFSIDKISVVIAIGNPGIRQDVFSNLFAKSNPSFPTIIHPGASIHAKDFVTVSRGSYISDGCILTTDIRIGEFSFLLPGVSLSHDTEIGSFCTLMPGVRVASGAKIGNRVTIGPGTIIASPIKIRDGAVIQAGKIITADI
jgi:sugar O-acyltransferase (sialic acid O-acetyltransferase NeuD family)